MAKGLLEYLLALPASTPKLMGICMNILGNVILENTDNAEILLSNDAHRILFGFLTANMQAILTANMQAISYKELGHAI